ncbi:MAG: site-specific DNA-methyltransferase [Methylococcales bacterium]|nr:site-specific DNA-methyltransferase [Methylococcales bacterium]
MPTLTWVGKDKVVNHHLDVPFRVLQHEQHYQAPQDTPTNSTDNRIIHGDNLAALKSLLPEFEGKINCIYIDPPYNTGNESWVYNDAVNDPKIKKWLGQVVGKEGEDLSRHDKWLCMMYPRLKLLHRLLAKDGVIFVSIGDDELASLIMLMNEIWGGNNQAGIFIWKSRAKPSNVGNAKFKPQKVSEYVLAYTKKPDGVSYVSILSGGKRNYPHSLNNRKYRLQTILKSNRGENQRDTMRFEVAGFIPSDTQRWQGGKEFIHDLYQNGYIEFKNDIPFRRYFEDEEAEEHSPFYTFIYPEESGTAETGKNVLNLILGNTHGFDTVKPIQVIERLLSAVTQPDSIILDSYAGSGTTAHAVLKLNAQDQGNRRFILIEMEDYADTITAERVRRVMSGYGEGNKQTTGLGGSFDYYTVGAAIFNPDDTLNEAVGVDVIRDYVSYAEGIAAEYRTPQNKHETLTASPLEDWQSCSFTPYLLGLSPETAWIFYYELDEVTCLDLDFLGTLKFGNQKPATAIIYADKCLLTKEFLTKHGLIFKKIPRDITRF